MRPKHSDCYDGVFTRKTGIKRRKKGVWRMRNRTDFGAKYCCEVCLHKLIRTQINVWNILLCKVLR